MVDQRKQEDEGNTRVGWDERKLDQQLILVARKWEEQKPVFDLVES